MPVINKPNQYFDAKLFTGTSSDVTVSGVEFQPNFVWLKSRNNAQGHGLYDAVRGGNKILQTNTTGADITLTSPLVFNSDGFVSTTDTHTNGYTYVAWQWKAGGAAVSNTAGTIASQVSSNPTSGFSVVTYTGNGTGGATVGHGCQVNGIATAPVFYIVKQRTTATATSWYCYNKYLDTSSPQNYAIYLNLSLGRDPASAFWNNTAPTDTLFSLGTSTGVNDSGGTYVAYCWAPVAGYSAFGSYTGNGATDGAFIYTGFRPKFVIIRSTGAEDWRMFDTSRSTYNIQGATLYPNETLSENAAQLIDINSNGFKCRTLDGAVNGGGTSYIYMAFAENPFKYASAR